MTINWHQPSQMTTFRFENGRVYYSPCFLCPPDPNSTVVPLAGGNPCRGHDYNSAMGACVPVAWPQPEPCPHCGGTGVKR